MVLWVLSRARLTWHFFLLLPAGLVEKRIYFECGFLKGSYWLAFLHCRDTSSVSFPEQELLRVAWLFGCRGICITSFGLSPALLVSLEKALDTGPAAQRFGHELPALLPGLEKHQALAVCLLADEA